MTEAQGEELLQRIEALEDGLLLVLEHLDELAGFVVAISVMAGVAGAAVLASLAVAIVLARR